MKKYKILWRGRGAIIVSVTDEQARILKQIQKKISHEFLAFKSINRKYCEQCMCTPCKQ